MSTQIDAWDSDGLVTSSPGGGALDGSVLTCSGYDTAIRWQRGERLDHLFEERCDRLRDEGGADHLAVDAPDSRLTYDQLDARANQLARFLLASGAGAGDRVALLFDDPVHAYVGMLAVLKIRAAYVPLDAGFPADRLSYIVQDAGVRAVLSLSHLRDRIEHVPATLVCLDEVASAVAAHSHRRLGEAERPAPVDELCYIIYTSGSTGRPKGVAIEHASICNFVRVAVEVYGMGARDRVYQGMTIAFDFAVEEIWVPLVAGATLVPKPAGTSLLGADLHDFLSDARVSALCCVPTLLATLEDDLPGLRFLLVSGEACPQDLIARWHRPGRRFLNVYGPTEATVTATWTEVHPERRVTIGVPLPTYSVVILDPTDDRALPPGGTGEIGIAGIGLARGYVNRSDLTERAFIPDFLGVPGNPSRRIYRTGDLGRVNSDGEIEYLGRIDTQVKIRGYRIELTEIESVLLQVPGIAQAVVDTFEPEPGVVELVGYYSLRRGARGLDPEQVHAQLQKSLPPYMVPAYLEHLPVIPMLPSHKADRKSLPAPTRRRAAVSQERYVAPTTPAERVLAELLASVMRLEKVSADAHFFSDLGANSLLMTQFCARARQRPDLPSVSIRDVYLNPTIRQLATALGDAAPAADESLAVAPEAPGRASTAQYVLCGAAQVVLFLCSAYLAGVVLTASYQWISAPVGWWDTYRRALEFSVATFLAWSAVPILAKWLLVGRWKPQEIRVWSLGYLRFWLVKVLVRANPMVLFVGSPLYVLYLKALGAKIGRRVVILSRTVPVCTDLLTIGDGTVIRKDAFFPCYRAQAGRIQTGPVTLGSDVFVGEMSVLDIRTSMGDSAQLGHSSSLHAGQTVPDGQRWHGSPAQPAEVDYKRVAAATCGALRRFSYSALQLLTRVALVGPAVFAILVTLFEHFPPLARLLSLGSGAYATWAFYRDALALSFVLFFGGVLAGLVLVLTVPRVLNLALTPDRVYPLYGLRHWVQQSIARLTNIKFFTFLFGDSSYIVHYLKGIGYDLSRVEQTGSNFGMAIKHATPFLSVVGTGTMVSDGLSIINADFSNTSFRVSCAAIGPRNFLGNNIAYPAGGRTGDNCLLATKVMVPLDGEVREGVGLLGSPCFEIPRSVQRDMRFDHLKTGEELRRRLFRKNVHNAVTIVMYLAVRWVYTFGALVLGMIAADLYGDFGATAVATAVVAMLAFTVAYFVIVERCVAAFHALLPTFCSIYEPYFWGHERYWKVPAMAYIQMFNGTPFKALIWRLLGVPVGRRLFDDGCWFTERGLVSVGNDCTLSAGSTLQSHSLEDASFKSDRIEIGDGCTIGMNAFVHYGVSVGDGSVLDADSFLMKGEQIPSQQHWRGNPARVVRKVAPRDPAVLPAPRQPTPTVVA